MPTLRVMSIAVAIASFALLVAYMGLKAYTHGVCCADDSFIAHVAKNVALGDGYVSTLQDNTPAYSHAYRRLPFDPMISTGPTLVLPASGFIAALGNRTWVPGMALVMVVAFLLVAIRVALGKTVDTLRLDLAVPVFVALSVVFTGSHFYQWHSLLGEVPAALLVVLALAVGACRTFSPAALAATGVLLGLAFLAKALALLYLVALVAVLALVMGSRGLAVRRVVAAMAGFALPVLAFELWKLLTLGLEGYLRAWVTWAAMLKTYGAPGFQLGLIAKIGERSGDFFGRVGFSLFEINAVSWFAVAVAYRYKRDFLFPFTLSLAAGVTLQTVWWVTSSIGWPRYMVIALVITAVLAATPILALPKPKQLWIYLCILLVWSLSSWGRAGGSLVQLDTGRKDNLDATVSFLLDQTEAKPYFGQWWGSVADLEYRLPRSGNFMGFRAITAADWQRGFLIADNNAFVAESDEEFSQLRKKCGQPVLLAPPYSVYRCGGQR